MRYSRKLEEVKAIGEIEDLQDDERELCECRGPDVGCDHSSEILG